MSEDTKPKKTSADVREDIISALRTDVFGPDTRPQFHQSHMDNTEVLNATRPSSFYLIGYLTPAEGSVMSLQKDDAPEIRQSPLPSMEDDPEPGAAAGEDSDGGTEAKQRKRLTPSSLGITAFVAPDCPCIDVTLRYADYIAQPPIPEAVLDGNAKNAPKEISWHRKPKTIEHQIKADKLMEAAQTPGGIAIPLFETESPQRKGGVLHLHLMVQQTKLPRPDADIDGLSVTVFVVNRRPASQRFRDVSNVFQVGLSLKAGGAGFIGNPDMSGYKADDPDLRLHDLHYRDVLRFAGGRNIGTGHAETSDDHTTEVWTDPLPSADVEKVDQNEALNAVTQFNMLDLAELAKDGGALTSTLQSFPDDYAKFIAEQSTDLSAIDTTVRRDVAQDLVAKQDEARVRMQQGIELLSANAAAREAFRAMNLSINSYLEKRDIKRAAWRPFQLAFILLNLNGLSDPTHIDRKTVDLLFFPTGGGKTEAYLGLAAFQIAYRRLTNPDWLGSGVCVIMRYTLRLLTLDQLGRAAAMICALELLRRSSEWRNDQSQPMLGLAPIEIGLWVGAAATPNLIGGRGEQDSRRRHAYTKVNDYRKTGKEAPAPIKECPWCGTPFGKDTFHVVGKRMLINCDNIDCDFSAENGGLPVLAVDEEIYDRLPAFIVGTVDKFASLPRRGAVGRFFDNVDRISADKDTKHLRFYGADEPGVGYLLNNEGECLPPPSLIIQDELHLISGPLGTIAGLYEAMVDRLASRIINGELRGPKIVASTATVRRAEDQIEKLFGRDKTAIFPPPGIDRHDSYFALTRPLDEAHGRRYLAISALGIGPRKVLLRSIVPILSTAQKQFDDDPRDGAKNPADPYMTALCYFNALRELGASRRIVEDEVANNLRSWPFKRLRDGQDITDSPFANRNIAAPEELTSRLSTDLVARAKTRLAENFLKNPPKGQDGQLDVALATNMISVGLDITRLGLMLVQNQPKSAAEYIQATSRVGRDSDRPGMVLVILNMHRARDRAHYEDFETYHKAFYRAVEATSVTPGSMRAKDRALGAVFAGLVRHLNPDYAIKTGASKFDPTDPAVIEASKFLKSRLCLQEDLDKLIESWEQLLADKDGENLFWDTNRADDQGLMHNPLTDISALSSDFELYRAGWSMRDVQPGIDLDVKDYLAGPQIAKKADMA
ncbi:MAG: DISARM system helicase DrmA [Fimbriimonadaceae bacterium]|nr:DISARM system helicase DrmA [Alphaproteobacteria bacterium]